MRWRNRVRLRGDPEGEDRCGCGISTVKPRELRWVTVDTKVLDKAETFLMDSKQLSRPENGFSESIKYSNSDL